jgi:cytochrome P450
MESRATGTRVAASAGFEAAKLEKFSLRAWLFNLAFSYPASRCWMDPFRWLTPVLPLLGWKIVLRYDEVREVLSQDRAFPVPWGWKMVEVTGGEHGGGRNFVLGMPRDDTYRLSYEQLAQAFPLADVEKYVEPLAERAATEIIAAVGRRDKPEFDAIEELITAVPTQLCEDYYGLVIRDKVAFAKWTLAVSSYLFGPPFEKQAEPNEGEKLAHAGAECLREVIRKSIGRPGKGVVLPRLREMQRADPRVTDDVIHAQLFGMVLGFIPTDVLAGGNILETLLKRPAFLERARAAALAGDDELLWRCLRETLRFRNINPGPARVVGGAGHTLNRGKCGQWRFKPGAKVLASTQAAMFDPRRVKRPHVFDPDRPDEDYLSFSVGQHWCLGAYIAIAQITQTFKPLLKQEGLAALEGRRGRMKRFSLFPLHLGVTFSVRR